MKPKKVDPIELFQVLGASEDADPKSLEQTAKGVGASREVVEFMEKLPPDVTEPSEVVAAAADPDHNDAGVELELPQEQELKPELTVEDVVEGNDRPG
jgi:hypothetical protein